MRKELSIIIVYVLLCSSGSQAGIWRLLVENPRVLNSTVVMLGGASAADAFANADTSRRKLGIANGQVQTLRSLEKQLGQQQPQQFTYLDDDAIYGFYLTLENGASSVYWADILNKPDVFLMMGIEGEGMYIFPDMTAEYAGQPLLLKLFHKRLSPGRRVIIYVMDDDTMMNQIWNNILSIRHEYSLSALVTPLAGQPLCMDMIRVDASVRGTIKLLDRPMTIDAQDFIASVEFTVPQDNVEPWMANGRLSDSSHKQVGQLQFAQLWTPAQEAIELAKKIQAEAIECAKKAREEAERLASEAEHEFVFWSIYGVFCVVAMIVYFMRGSRLSRHTSAP